MLLGENLELLEKVTSDSDNIAEVEMTDVRDGSEYGTRSLIGDGVEGLQELLADIWAWDGGIRQFLTDKQRDPELIERIMAGRAKACPNLQESRKMRSSDVHERSGVAVNTTALQSPRQSPLRPAVLDLMHRPVEFRWLRAPLCPLQHFRYKSRHHCQGSPSVHI